jgi:RNA polymerase sigma-70 factor (ECF subfamily)
MLPPAEPIPPSENTQDMARRVREAGNAHFRALYERIAPSLYAWTRLRTNASGSLRADCDDVLQEVWLRAVQELPQFDAARATFRAWIFGIAKNVLYEMWRQDNRHGASARGAHPGGEASACSHGGAPALDEWPDVATTIRTRLARDEAVERLLAHAVQLDAIDRKLLIACGFEDMTCTEAATRLGIRPDAAIKRWQRLRERLAERGFEELLELRAAG